MSHFLDRLTFFNKVKQPFAGGHGITTNEDRRWEDGYRKRWQHDKIVRSTHGANCTGSCSWKIYVKGGIVTWETQQTDYPRTRPDFLSFSVADLPHPTPALLRAAAGAPVMVWTVRTAEDKRRARLWADQIVFEG